MQRYWVLIVAAIAAFGGSLRGSFHFDDYSLLVNPSITTTAGLWLMWGPLGTRPLTNLTFWLNYRLNGSEPLGYHIASLTLHAVAVLLLYLALEKTMSSPAAFWGAALFAVHPIQSEAVAYVFARSTLLSAVFCLASLWFWLGHRLFPAIACFACALFAKEECVTFPLVLLLLTVRQEKAASKELRAIAAMIALALLAGARAAWATAQIAGSGAGFSAGISPATYLLNQGPAVLRYLRLAVFPSGLTIEPTVTQRSVTMYAAAWIVVAALIIAAWWLHRKCRPWATWFLAGVILLIPGSSIFPAADLAADRRMYLPMIAFSAAFGVITPSLWKQIPVLLIAALLLVSISRVEVWRTEQNLWREAVQQSPQHVRPLLQLSRVVGETEAVTLLNQAKSLEPNNGSIPAELGRVWLKGGRPDLALGEFGRALALAPGDANAFNNRGAALLGLKQERAARQDFERALRIDPCLEAARQNLQALGAASLPACTTAK